MPGLFFFLPRFAGEVAVAKRLTEGVAEAEQKFHRRRHPLRLTCVRHHPRKMGEEN
jgi:hypothetical protein